MQEQLNLFQTVNEVSRPLLRVADVSGSADYSLPKKMVRYFRCSKNLYAGKNEVLHAFKEGKTYQQVRCTNKAELVLISEIAQHHRVAPGEWEKFFEFDREMSTDGGM